MSNSELLDEYEFTVALYINAKDEETTEKYEKYLRKLRIEILKRMEEK